MPAKPPHQRISAIPLFVGQGNLECRGHRFGKGDLLGGCSHSLDRIVRCCSFNDDRERASIVAGVDHCLHLATDCLERDARSSIGDGVSVGHQIIAFNDVAIIVVEFLDRIGELVWDRTEGVAAVGVEEHPQHAD